MAYAIKNAQKTGIATIIIATLFVFFVTVLLQKDNRSDSYLSNDPVLERKAQILALASPGKDLTPEVRAVLFQYLSGPKLLDYNFTTEEKAQIINFLNGKK